MAVVKLEEELGENEELSERLINCIMKKSSTWVRHEVREYLSTDRIPQRHVMVEVVEDSNGQMFSIWVLYIALLSQLGIVVGRDCEAEELADGVVGVVDFVVLGGEGVEEEGGEGGGGYVGGV